MLQTRNGALVFSKHFYAVLYVVFSCFVPVLGLLINSDMEVLELVQIALQSLMKNESNGYKWTI